MDAQDYLDWSRMSGLYLRNISHVDRYRTFRPQLSRAGLTTLIVAEFLENADPVVDAVAWRTHNVYEMGADQQERIELTAEALDAIGATRIGNAVRIARSNSPFAKITELFSTGNLKSIDALKELIQGTKGVDLLNHMRENVSRMMPELAEQAGLKRPAPDSPVVSPDHESREQIEHLLEQFLATHRTELQRDLSRHGDPRQEPGYTREARLLEIDRLRKQLYASEAQKRDVGTLRELTGEIRKLIGNPGEGSKKTQSKLEKLRVQFRNLYKEHRGTPEEELIPEMAMELRSAESFMASLPEVFAPKKLGDDKLTARLEEIGEYETGRSGGQTEIQWDDPQGFDCDWTSLKLTLCYPKSKPKSLEQLLDAVNRLRQHWHEQIDNWRDQLITCFRDVYQIQMQDWEFEDYEVDDNGDATDESILAHVEGGQILMDYYPEDASIHGRTFFDVDWDSEHGFEIEWEDEPDTIAVDERDQSSDENFDVESLGLQDVGPKLTGADIVRFESTFGLELPSGYRQFLLAANGGRPRRNSFTAKIEGAKFPADVVRFFSLTSHSAESDSAESLEAVVQQSRDQKWSAELLPIAKVRHVGMGLMPDDAASYLVLVLAGAKAGRVLVANPYEMDQMFPGLPPEAAQKMAAEMMRELADHSPVAGRSLAEFMNKLKEPAADKVPVWLKAIREDDVGQFLNWVHSGGKCDEKFQDRGIPMPMQVIDYLACHASANLLEHAREQDFFKPKQLRDSWDRYCQRDIHRFKVLMNVLPKEMWKCALSSYQVWDHPDLWEELASAGVDFNEAVDDEGQTPIQLAVQCGKTIAVKWLMEHGADPAKFDKYQRNAFTWTDRGPGYDCLATLEGKDNLAPPRAPREDVAGIELIHQAANTLSDGTSLVIVVQIKSPPVTRIEKAWSTECHYRLSIDVQRRCVTFNDMTSARQDYLHADNWPAVLFLPIIQWPQLTPLWNTLEVHEFDWNAAMKKRNYQPNPRPDLLGAAREALHQTFDAEEAAARGVRLRK